MFDLERLFNTSYYIQKNEWKLIVCIEPTYLMIKCDKIDNNAIISPILATNEKKETNNIKLRDGQIIDMFVYLGLICFLEREWKYFGVSRTIC